MLYLCNCHLRKCVPAVEVLARRKCGILNFTKAAQLEVDRMLLHYLAAVSDPNDAVARLGDELLKKRWSPLHVSESSLSCTGEGAVLDYMQESVIILSTTISGQLRLIYSVQGPGKAKLGGGSAQVSWHQDPDMGRCGLDSAKPAVDLESPPLVSRLFALFHGTPPSSSLAVPNRIAPASRSLQARLMTLFCKSVTAANCAPFAYQVRFGAVVGKKLMGVWLLPHSQRPFGWQINFG